MYKRPVHILFVCTGNSCRSQMAEGYTRHLGGKWVEVQSAGIAAHGKNPRAIAIMAEDGVDISSQVSTKLTDEMIQWADLVVTVCGHADEHCPALPSHVQKKHWPLADPAKAIGTEEEVRRAFLTVRDEIKGRVQGLLGGIRMIS